MQRLSLLLPKGMQRMVQESLKFPSEYDVWPQNEFRRTEDSDIDDADTELCAGPPAILT